MTNINSKAKELVGYRFAILGEFSEIFFERFNKLLVENFLDNPQLKTYKHYGELLQNERESYVYIEDIEEILDDILDDMIDNNVIIDKKGLCFCYCDNHLNINNFIEETLNYVIENVSSRDRVYVHYERTPNKIKDIARIKFNEEEYKKYSRKIDNTLNYIINNNPYNNKLEKLELDLKELYNKDLSNWYDCSHEANAILIEMRKYKEKIKRMIDEELPKLIEFK